MIDRLWLPAHPADAPQLGAAQAACRGAAVSLVFASAYAASNLLTHARAAVIGPCVFAWEQAIPFLPWTIVPYLSLFIFLALSFLVHREVQTFTRHVRAMLCCLALALLCYAALPLRFTFDRPVVDGLYGLLFTLLNTVDMPYNRAPSLHIALLVILWARLRPVVTRGWQRAALQGWFGLIGVSVLTTYQHHVIDIPAGLLLGWVSLLLARRWRGEHGTLRPLALQPVSRPCPTPASPAPCALSSNPARWFATTSRARPSRAPTGSGSPVTKPAR